MPWRLLAGESGDARELVLKPGKTVTVGRATGAAEMFPDDPYMSSLHFTVGLNGSSVRLQNVSKTNPVELNGSPVQSATLKPGDRILAGETLFVLHEPEPSPFPARVRIGGWGFESVPQGWDLVENTGFQLSSDPSFRATMSVCEEALPAGETLAAYVDLQAGLIRSKVSGAQTSPPAPAEVRGAEEAIELSVTTPIPDGEVMQIQIYALSGGVIGIFTSTVRDRQVAGLKDVLASTRAGLSYFQS